MLKDTLKIINFVIANRSQFVELLGSLRDVADIFDGNFSACVSVEGQQQLFILEWDGDDDHKTEITPIPQEYIDTLQRVARLL